MINKIIIIIYVVITSISLIIMKIGSKDGAPAMLADGRLEININLFTVMGIVFYGISFLLYIYLLSRYDLGYIIPITTALVYALIFTASFFIFKESFTTFKLIGIVLIIMGIALMNIGPKN